MADARPVPPGIEDIASPSHWQSTLKAILVCIVLSSLLGVVKVPTYTVMTSSDVEPFLRYLKAQRFFVDNAQVAAFAIFEQFYDYLLMLNLEITTIWMQRWTYTKVLFIITRYLPFGYAYFVFQNHILMGMEPKGCSTSYSVSTWLLFVDITLAETVLSIRTWAVWHCNVRIGLLLVTVHVVNSIVACVYLWRYIDSFIYAPAPYPGFRGCFVTIPNSNEYVSFVMLTIVETVVFCLMATAAIRAHRLGLTNQFSNVVHRDAIHFYVFLMLLAVMNIVVMLSAPPSYQNFLTPLQGVLHSVFTSRIIIHLRVAGKQHWENIPTELHTYNVDDAVLLGLEERGEEPSL